MSEIPQGMKLDGHAMRHTQHYITTAQFNVTYYMLHCGKKQRRLMATRYCYPNEILENVALEVTHTLNQKTKAKVNVIGLYYAQINEIGELEEQSQVMHLEQPRPVKVLTLQSSEETIELGNFEVCQDLLIRKPE